MIKLKCYRHSGNLYKKSSGKNCELITVKTFTHSRLYELLHCNCDKHSSYRYYGNDTINHFFYINLKMKIIHLIKIMIDFYYILIYSINKMIQVVCLFNHFMIEYFTDFNYFLIDLAIKFLLHLKIIMIKLKMFVIV